jgi:Inner membrane protein YgaP-like, transmembrane domain
MIKNVGKKDQIFRLLLALFLTWFGLVYLNGIQGNIWGILVTCASLLPYYMVLTRRCFVFGWCAINSLSKKEQSSIGESEKAGD